MLTYLPAIYPDELVYSWFCRYYVHSGCYTHKMALQELFCKRSDTPSKEFIGNLHPEARKIIEEAYPLDMLVQDHTMYRMYARFIPEEKRKQALYRIGHDHCDAHHLFCVLPRTGDEQYMRYCPLCAKEDRARYGETFWHRKHQIPNMSICTKHRCRLLPTEITAKSEQNYVFCPAESVIGDDGKVTFEDDREKLRYAVYVESVFDAPIHDEDIPISAVLYDKMSGTKYMKPSGRSRHTRMLADDMNAYYQNMGLHSIASMYQIQKTLIGGYHNCSVICQIAFYLGISSEELTSPSLSKEQIQKAESSHYMKNAEPVDWDLLDAEILPVLTRIARHTYDGSASDIGRPERVSERLVYRELGLKGHQLENMPRCRVVLSEYEESYPESWARKLIWAYEKLTNEGVPFYWSDIRKLAGIKKIRFQEIKPFLFNYVDAESVERISAITEGKLVD